MLVSPARRRIGLDIEVLRLPPLSTLFALEDNQSSASARTHHLTPPRRRRGGVEIRVFGVFDSLDRADCAECAPLTPG